MGIERRGEAGEDPGAKSGDDRVGSAAKREDDAFDAGPNGAHLLEESHAFLDGVVCAGDDDAEGSDAHSLEGVCVAGGVLHGEAGGFECIADLAADRGVASDDEDSAHGVLGEEQSDCICWYLRR